MPPLQLGSQLITLSPQIKNYPFHFNCQIAVKNKDYAIIGFDSIYYSPTNYRYLNTESCNGNVSNKTVRFLDDGLHNGNYHDEKKRSDTIELCTTDKWFHIKFARFKLAPGDTLAVYQGDLAALQLDSNPQFLKASGNHPSQAFGGSISANTNDDANISGCLTFIFSTNGDNISDSGWSAYWNCSKILCPNPTIATKSLLPDSLGTAIIMDSSKMHKFYYEDEPLFCIGDEVVAVNRYWKFLETDSILSVCEQGIHWHRDFENVRLPKDTTLKIQDYIKYSDDLSITGQVFIADIPVSLNKEYLNYQLIHQDSFISSSQIKRKFSIKNFCETIDTFRYIGYQIIYIHPDRSDYIIPVYKGDTTIISNNKPHYNSLIKYEYQSPCSFVTYKSPRFIDDKPFDVNYQDSIARSDTIEICAKGKVVRMVFLDFDLNQGDTLFAYRGNLASLKKDSAVTFLKASGTGVAKAYGGWIDASDKNVQNDSGCFTFIFQTNGDRNKGTGWDSFWDCADFTCPANARTNESLHPSTTGYPIYTNQSNIVDTVFYRDDVPHCSEDNETLKRTWTIQYQSGASESCVQEIYLNKKRVSDIQLPTDSIFTECTTPTALADWNITGAPTIDAIPFSKNQLTFGLSVQSEDSIISNHQIKRKFSASDTCTQQMPIFIGAQLLTFPSIGDEDHDTVIDCKDLCPGGDDRINSDGTGMPDACDCDPNNPNDEFVNLSGDLIDSTYKASFQLSSTGNIIAGNKVTFHAGRSIILKPGFHSILGSQFNAQIVPNCNDKQQENTKTINNIPKIALKKQLNAPLQMSVSPNPFANSTSIKFQIPQEGQVKLSLYNSWGVAIKTLQKQKIMAGSHQTQLSSEDMPRGIYYLVLQTEVGQITKKLIILDSTK
jgi:hypothetical protein